jgi:hypothetical protein
LPFAIRRSGRWQKLKSTVGHRDSIQHAGPKLSGYATSATTKATVIQNPAVGFFF